MNNISSPSTTRINLILISTLSIWAFAVCVAALSGAIASMPMPYIAALVAVGIALPTLCYFTMPPLREHLDRFGHRNLMLLHLWRIPAALLFFWYGAKGLLPTPFWLLAGVGDFIAGSYVLVLVRKPESVASYRAFHRFGFADFAVAVGTGLTFTLLEDPRMAPIAALPLALIPLFGVGISGATHLIAFDMLRRGTGLRSGVRHIRTYAA
jgi:hypothetical protein